MLNQQSNSYQQLIPAADQTVAKRVKSPNWNIRKQTYEQILYLLQQEQIVSSKNVFQIGGKQYTVKKLIPIFQDIVDEDHPIVLLCALHCVEIMIQKQLCSGREFVKLTDQGFDKFPLRTNKGKQIMQKFADIIQKIQVQPQFLLNKLNSSAHQKCIIFALEVVGMLGMTQLLKKVRQISQKHAKKAVRQVATQICQQLQELQTQATDQTEQSSKMQINPGQDEIQNNSTQNLKIPTKPKPRRKTPTKPNKASRQQQTNTLSKNQLDVLQKVAQFQKLNSKQQQKQIQSLSSFFQRHFNLLKQGKPVPTIPSNQLGNLSYVIRITIQSNNVILATNGLKLLKTLTENNCPLIPRSYPLLFIFEKYKLRASHQVNQLLFDVCDSLLLSNSMSTIRNIDLLQAVSEGANNKKENVKVGSFMVFLRSVSLLYKNQRLFMENFGNQENQDYQRFIEIFQKINEGDLQKIKIKLHKNLIKCLQNFSAKMGDDKKYDEKLQDVRIIMSLAYGSSGNNPTSTKSAVSIDNIKTKTLTKTLSQVSPKVQTYNNPKSKPTTQNQQHHTSNSINKQKSVHSIRNPNPQIAYKILNPQQKSNKILSLCSNPTPGSISSIKKLVLQSLIQFQQCINEHRFQLFYYSQVLDYFISSYQPHDKTADIISQYMLQLLLKISKIKSKNLKLGSTLSNTKYLQQGIRNIIKICLCDLFLGQQQLYQIFNNFVESNGINNIIQALIMLNQCKRQNKIKKKNRKIILQWLDGNVPTECLSDKLFQIMDRIEKGLPLGILAQSQKQEGETGEKQFRQTFGRDHPKNQEQCQYNEPREDNPQMVKKITFSQQQENNFVNSSIKNKKQNLPSYDDMRNKVKDQKQKKFNGNQNKYIQNINEDESQIIQTKQIKKQPIKSKQPIQPLSLNEPPLNSNYTGQYSEKLKQKQQELKNEQIKFLQHLKNNNTSALQQIPSPNAISKSLKYDTIFSQLSPSSSIQQSSSIFNNINNVKNNPKNNLKNINNNVPLTNPLDRSQISYIDYKQDPSISLLTSQYGGGGGGTTDRQLLQQYQQNIKNKDNNKINNNNISQYDDGNGNGQDGDGDQQQTSKYQKYYNQYKKQKQIQSQIKQKQYQQSMYKDKDKDKDREREIDRYQLQKKYNIKNDRSQIKDLQYSIDADNQNQNEQDRQQKQTVQNYKKYIQNIRKAYLPKQYIQKNQNTQNIQVQQDKQINNIRASYAESTPVPQQQQIKMTVFPIKQNIPSIQQPIKPKQIPPQIKNQPKQSSQKTQIKKQQSQSQPSEQQQQQTIFEYKILNANKLTYMLQHASNPYSHLRNQIIIPYKKSQQKQYFIKQLNLFVTSIPQIKQPQPYNALLLTIILLFSQIQTKPTLLDPLQQLYSYMASLTSTNQFLRTIISLFHSVIEQTSSHQRDFLIIILTKSVSRLMPFCQDPILLLRDLAQFYNVGQNVYFQMYQKQYMEICKVIEGDALYEVVQGGLVKQGENLNVIVESFFQTRFKNKVKEYIKEIISENQQEGLESGHRQNGDEGQYF